MEPRIQYATTSDGVSIAFSSLGEGIPLVIPPPATPFSHIELEWQIPEWRHWYEHLTERCRVVRYDTRGSGLSDRDVTDLSVAAQVRDLEAVVDRLDLKRFALFGCYFSGPTCITYAAAHPERVSHLMLWCSIIRNNDEGSNERGEALKQLMAVDYALFTETLAHTVFGWNEGEAAHAMAVYMQNSMTRGDDDALVGVQRGPRCGGSAREGQGADARDAAPRLSRAGRGRRPPHRFDAFPDARLAMLDGTSLSPYIGDTRDAPQALLRLHRRGVSGRAGRGAHASARRRSPRRAASARSCSRTWWIDRAHAAARRRAGAGCSCACTTPSSTTRSPRTAAAT